MTPLREPAAGPDPGGPEKDPLRRPSFREALKLWGKLGLISFGGPAGQIAIMHAELVEKRGWISPGRFLHALNFCLLLPGPEAQQLAAYCGWLLHGTRGALAAGVLFVLPAAFLLWGLSWLYAAGGEIPWVAAVFLGLQPAVLAIVVAALLRIAGKTLTRPVLWIMAGLAFGAISFLQISFFLIIPAAALLGFLLGNFFPDWLPSSGNEGGPAGEDRISEPLATRPWRTVVLGLVFWGAPLALLAGYFGWDSVWVKMGGFFSKTALITFGGAYAVLPYVAQQAVEVHGWLEPSQMMAGLALAETTPGPLIMVLQFVGFLGAWHNPGPLSPLLAGTLGAAITTWVTFLPGFLFILIGAPHMERLREVRALNNALSGITAAVVGVILSLAVWFGHHMIFSDAGWDPLALALASGFFFGVWRLGWSVPLVVLAAGLLGLLRL